MRKKLTICLMKKHKGKRRSSSNRLSGTIRMHPRGFGFVIPDEGSSLKEDIFIPQRKTLSAVEGDKVEVIYQTGYSGKGIEGEIVAILERSRRHIAGTLAKSLGKEKWLAYVPLLGPERQMIVSAPSHAYLGARMIFEVTHWGSSTKAAKGIALSLLGNITDGSCDIKAAIEEFELMSTFSEEVKKEIASFSKRLSSNERKEREDFTDLETFTIDPDESKDFDDALSLTLTKNGYRLYVHVADVSHYVKPHTHLDKEALARCNSVYFPGGVLPMLPPALSNDLCSLKPNVKRLTVTVIIDLDHEANVQEYRIVRSIIKSKRRFTYNEAKKVLDGKVKSIHKPTLEHMVTLCLKLKKQRTKRGAIEFAMPDLDIKVDEQGKITAMYIVSYDITHQMVEEFMLKANELVAITLSKEQKPLTYRIHEEPNPEKLRDFAMYAKNFGFTLSTQPTSDELQQLFDQTRDSSFGKCLTTAFIRTMKLASYSTQNVGHYGLMLEHYTHFTSPIRRYVDLIVHRLLFNESDPQLQHEMMALQCSEKERNSAKAESSVIHLKKLRYISDLFTKNPQQIFSAVITSIKPFGISFEITSLFIDGFLHAHEFGTSFTVRKKQQNLILYNGKKPLTAGSSIEVQIVDVDLITRSAHWRLAKKKTSSKRESKE